MSSTQFNYEEEHQKYRVEFCFDEFEVLDPRHFGYYIDEELWRDPQTGKYFNGNLEEVFPDIDIDDVEEIEPDPEADTDEEEEEEIEPDPEADTEDEEEEEIFDPEATDTEDEEEPDIFSQFMNSQSVFESLQRYREQKKKVLDSFELLKPDEHPYDYDLYRDIETGRVFDLEGEEYFQQNQ